MISRPVLKFGTLILLAAILAGCWDRIEINDTAYVLITAVDKVDNDQYRYSAMIPLPGQMGGAKGGGGGTSGNNSYYIESEVGSTFRDAQAKLQKRMARVLFHGHRRVIVIGEGLARDGIGVVYDAIARRPENRLTTILVVAEGEGESLLRTQPRLEMFSAEAIRELAKRRDRIPINLKNVSIALSQSGNDAIMVHMGKRKIGAGKEQSEEVEVLGYAQFRGDKLVGFFKEAAAHGLTLLTHPESGYTANTKIRDSHLITYQVISAKTRIQPEIREGVPHFSIHVLTQIKLLESMHELDLHNTNNEIDAAVGESVREMLEAAIRKVQEEGADSVALGMRLSRHYPRQWRQTYRDEWSSYLKKATFSYHVQVLLSEAGLIYENIVQKEGVDSP